jgi:hypothetical protein
MSLSLHQHDLVGFSWAGQTLMFSGSDSKELFQENLKKQPDDWYYKTHPITYSYNKQGHRCKEIKEIDFDNYILFVGDSNTEGVGLELETTHPYLTAQKLNTSYYNLGLGGVGMDVIFYNLHTWLCKFPKPKFVVIGMTDPVRFVASYSDWNNTNNNKLRGFGIHINDKNVQQFLSLGDRIGYFDIRILLMSNMIKNMLDSRNIPYEIISVTDFKVSSMPCKVFNYYGDNYSDTVRDMMHPGINVNKVITDNLVSQYHDKYLNARDNHDSRG